MTEYFANSPHELSIHVNHVIENHYSIDEPLEFIILQKVMDIDNVGEYKVWLRFHTRNKETNEVGHVILGNELHFGMVIEDLKRFVEIASNGQDIKRNRGEHDIFTVKAFRDAYRLNKFLNG